MRTKEAKDLIRAALKRRSGRRWSVTSDSKGTASGWIRVWSLPSECKEGHMTAEDCRALAELFGLHRISPQGISIADSNDYYQEYVDRAEGREPSIIAQPYWD